MKKILYFALCIVLHVFVNVKAQAQESYVTNIKNAVFGTSASINEIAYYETSVRYRDIVKFHPVSVFGIGGDATQGGVIVFYSFSNLSTRNGLIYGAYSNENDQDELPIAKDWTHNIYDRWGPAPSHVSSVRFRRLAGYAAKFDDSGVSGPVFKAWGRYKVNVKVTVVTIGSQTLNGMEFILPGLPDPLYESDFDQDYFLHNTVTWQDEDSTPTMFLDATDSPNEMVKIQSLQLPNEIDILSLDLEEVRLSVWGKMITHNAGVTPASIDAEYEYGLWVQGEIVSEDFIMLPKSGWADYVFDENYQLTDLKQIEDYIKLNGHLPGIPSADEIKNGYKQHEINTSFLEKIEALTLYRINQHQQVELNRIALERQKAAIDILTTSVNMLTDN